MEDFDLITKVNEVINKRALEKMKNIEKLAKRCSNKKFTRAKVHVFFLFLVFLHRKNPDPNPNFVKIYLNIFGFFSSKFYNYLNVKISLVHAPLSNNIFYIIFHNENNLHKVTILLHLVNLNLRILIPALLTSKILNFL